MQTDTTPSRRYFFIVGVGRSGTTLLRRMLDTHPQISVVPETHFMNKIWARRDSYGDLSDDENWGSLLKDVSTLRPFTLDDAKAQRFLATVEQGGRDYASLFRAVIESLLVDQDAELAGEKTPIHLRYIPQISEMFPGSLFIHIVRDPRAVVNSLRSVHWSTGTYSLDAHSWTSAMRAMRNLPDDVSQLVLTVRFEDLVQNPQTLLTRACDFLCVPYEPSMLEYYRVPFGSNINAVRDTAANLQKPPMPDNIDRWRRELSPMAVRDIESVAWRHMGILGYEPTHSLVQLLPYVITDTAAYGMKRIGHKVAGIRHNIVNQPSQ